MALNRRLALAAAFGPAAGLLLTSVPALAGPTTNDDVVVYRVGDGSAALTSVATPVFLDEFTTAGTQGAPLQTIALPTTGSGNQRRLVASGSATSEGLISRTADGTAVLATGYDAAPGLAGVASTTSANNNRIVARLTGDGLVDTSTALTDSPTGNNVRSASAATATLPTGSSAGSAVSVGGGAGNLRGTTLGAQGTSSQLNTDVANIRQVLVTDGKTFISTGSGATKSVGYLNGTTITFLPGLPTGGSPYSFALLDQDPVQGYAGGAADTIYVADDTPGTVTKYTWNGTTWTQAAQLSIAGVRGLAAKQTPTGAQIVVTTATTLFGITDVTTNPAAFTSTPVTLSSAPANEAYRGVAFTPTVASTQPPVSLPEVPLAALLPLGGLGAMWLGLRLRRRTRTA